MTIVAKGTQQAVVIALLLTVLAVAPAALAQLETSHFQVVVNSQKATSGYVQVDATMSGTVNHENGSHSTYKVPVSVLYPQEELLCSGIGIVDVTNSVFYETFDFAGTSDDPFFPSLFPFARLFLGDSFIQSRGLVYAQAQWDKRVFERQKQAGTLAEPEFHIDRGTDGYAILRDLSRFLRAPSEFLVEDTLLPCAVHNVIAFGFSQTGMLLRDFYFEGLNSQLALGPTFDEGLVFEGALHGAPGSHGRRLLDEEPWFSYTFSGREGATPVAEGKVITLNSETDVQLIQGWQARPSGETNHYRVYEMAGTSHIPQPVFDLKQTGVRLAEASQQNPADVTPVYRAMTQHLMDWVEGVDVPPLNATLQGEIAELETPLFSHDSWGSDERLVFLSELGQDGNALGGVRLPHVYTLLASGEEVGAPLGVYRGVFCGRNVEEDSLLECELSGDANVYNITGGAFAAYPQFEATAWPTFYTSQTGYLNLARDAAQHAVAEGWVLAEDADVLMAVAEQRMLELGLDLPLLDRDYSHEFVLSLSPGLNMVSLPLAPMKPYTARSFADKLSATVVIRLDAESQKFVGFTVDTPGDGFGISGGEGYIVSIPQGGTVTFTGAAFTRADMPSGAPAVSNDGAAWAFVVNAVLADVATSVHVRNLDSGRQMLLSREETSRYSGVWADLTREPVIHAGDVLEIEVNHIDGVLGKRLYQVRPGDVSRAYVTLLLDAESLRPRSSQVHQNYPNPFNPETWIPYELSESSNVVVRIYDPTGRLIRSLSVGSQDAGYHVRRSRAVRWDGRDSLGQSVASGTYFYQLQAGEFSATRKMTIRK